MIKSMTGFGKATASLKEKKITVEIRSLNSRQLDLNLRLSGIFREKENEIRTLLSKECERGKIDVSVIVETEKKGAAALINKKLAKEYYAELKKLAEELKAEKGNLLEIVMTMPEVMKAEREEPDPSEWEGMKNCFDKALKEMNRFRTDEGKALQKDLQSRIGLIQDSLVTISVLDQKRIPAMREKLWNSVSEIKDKIDLNRFEQELIFYIEKLDITEEKVRLKTHCSYFLQTMKEEHCGRKLNFIAQEIGREINTIGSKASDAGMQKLVVQMKDELEKIKEQVNNVL